MYLGNLRGLLKLPLFYQGQHSAPSIAARITRENVDSRRQRMLRELRRIAKARITREGGGREHAVFRDI